MQAGGGYVFGWLGLGWTPTLWSFRHTHATLAALGSNTDIHTRSKQVGNSAAMVERHYSKLRAILTVDKMALLE